MTTFPSSDESFALLHAAGWSVGEVAVASATGRRWLVTGASGENALKAEGLTQADAWHRAVQQAEAVGMLAQHAFFSSEGTRSL